MTKKPAAPPDDPLAKWRGEPDCLFFFVPCDEDVVEELAARWDGKVFLSWRCVRALPKSGGVLVVYHTEDARIIENFASPTMWGWPPDLVQQAFDTVNAIRASRTEQAEIARKEATWAEREAARVAEVERWK